MSFIEGIGDEVTAFFVILIVIVLAVFVTFIGSGSHLYLISPTHTRIIPVDEIVLTPQTPSPRVSRTETNLTPQPNSDGTVPWLPDDNRYYQEILSDNRPTDDVSDDTEEQSSSDDGRSVEQFPDTLEIDTPSAPTEENETQEAEPADPHEITVRLKYLDDTERTVKSNPTTKVGDFKRHHFSDELANNKIVRLIFCGHLLRDSSSLESYRVIDNSVIHVQILQAQTAQTRSAVTQNADLDISHLLWPLVTFVLGICWIYYFKYPEFFSMLSLGLLLLFTGSFMVFYNSHVH